MFISFQYIEYIHYGLAGLFFLALILQTGYYLIYYIRIAVYKRAPQLKTYPLSVIICAKNESENLVKNLPAVLEQDHEDFEVIVVDDCSTDSTSEVLSEFQQKYKHLRTTTITPDRKFTHGKKLAVTVGIKAAKNEWLVFTDADCIPVSNLWLKRIQENITDKTEIILGYGGYGQRKGLLNKYIRYDTIFIAMHYMGFALARKPYMGVGRNLAYRKSLFFRNKGFASHYHLLSGDDDLFVNETANKKNTAVEVHRDSHTISEPKYTWKQWFTQKKRHYSTSSLYQPKHYFMLGLEPLSRVLFFLTLCYLLIFKILWPYVLMAAGFRIILQIIVFKLTMLRLRERKLLFWILIFDLFSILINFKIYLSSAFRSKKSEWK